jgi:P-type conjugative transfer protein TrbJ
MTMHTVRLSLFTALVGLSLTLAPAEPAKAQWVVFDPGNFSQNILTAIRTLMSNVNEVEQIANQIQQINNEIQNLQHMPGALSGALLGDYVTEWNRMQNTFAAINGLSANIGTLAVNYQNLFPARGAGALTGPQVIAQLQQYLAQARQTYEGVYRQSGAVMAALPQAQRDMATTLAASNGATGNLDAIQAQTQMTAQVAQLLVQQNAQIAAMNQAQADWLNQQMEMFDTVRVMQTQSEAHIVRTQPAGPYLPTIH